MILLTKPKGFRAVFEVGGRFRQVEVVGWLQRDESKLPEAVCKADPLCISRTGEWVYARDVPGFLGVWRPLTEAYGEDYERHWRRCFPDSPVSAFAVERAPYVPSAEVAS